MRWTIEYIDGDTVLDIDFDCGDGDRAGVLFPGPGNYHDACLFILNHEDIAIWEAA